MYLLCSDWSIRSLEKEEEKEEKEEEENCHLLITARCTNEGRDKNIKEWDSIFKSMFDSWLIILVTVLNMC